MERSDKERRGQSETPGKSAMNREERRENYLTSNTKEDKESKFIQSKISLFDFQNG